MADAESEKQSEWSFIHTGSELEDAYFLAGASVLDHNQEGGYQASLTDESVCTDLKGLGSLGMTQPPKSPKETCTETCLVHDMRKNYNCVKGVRQQLPQDRISAAKSLGILPDQILECPDRVNDLRTVILGHKQTEKYILIKIGSSSHCLRIRQNFSADELLDQLLEIADGYVDTELRRFRHLSRYESYGLPVIHRPAAVDVKSIFLFFNKEHIDFIDALRLPSLSVVELVRIVHLEWRIYHRYKILCDKRYRVACRTIDTLEDIKRKFLSLHTALETTDEVSTDCLWLTQQNKLISDTLLKKTYDTVVSKSLNPSDMVRLSEHNSLLRFTTDPESGMVCVDDVFVHFQPQDAVKIETEFKADTNDKTNIRSLIMASPQMSAKDLREEVSKVVGKERNSIRISVGTTKLTSSVDLSRVLRTPGCKINVTLKAKITLSVHVVRIPPGDDEAADFTIPVYSYDLVQVMKEKLCRLTGAPEHSVDLYFERRPLLEDNTFSDHRIRDKDNIEAHIFRNRMRLSMKMPNAQWYDLLVDDCYTLTVGQVKAFAQNLDGHEKIHECELTVIVNDRVASDTEVLSDLRTRLHCMPKLILAKTKNFCFTSSTAHKGTFVVLSNTDGLWFQQFLVMFNGEELFYGPAVSEADGKVADLLQKRRCSPQPQPTVEGIRAEPRPHYHHMADCESRTRAMYTCSSPSSSSQTSEASTSKPDFSQQWAAAQSTTPSKQGQAGTGLQDKTSPQKKTRSSSVRFQTSSSISDMGCLDDEQTTTMEEQPPEPRKEGGDTLTSSDREDENPQQRRARERSKSSAADSGIAPEEVSPVVSQRSESCPVFASTASRPNNLPPMTSPVQRSGSDTSIEMNRTTILSETCRKNQDGSWTLAKSTRSVSRLSPGFVQELVASRPTATPVCFGAGPVVQYHDQQSQTVAFPDPAYRYVNERVIRHVAENLGMNGISIIRELGVNQTTIDQANAAYAKDPPEMFFFCLRSWCQKMGRRASKDTLKEALERCGRRDLAESLDEIDPDPPERSLCSPENETDPDPTE